MHVDSRKALEVLVSGDLNVPDTDATFYYEAPDKIVPNRGFWGRLFASKVAPVTSYDQLLEPNRVIFVNGIYVMGGEIIRGSRWYGVHTTNLPIPETVQVENHSVVCRALYEALELEIGVEMGTRGRAEEVLREIEGEHIYVLGLTQTPRENLPLLNVNLYGPAIPFLQS